MPFPQKSLKEQKFPCVFRRIPFAEDAKLQHQANVKVWREKSRSPDGLSSDEVCVFDAKPQIARWNSLKGGGINRAV